MEAFDRSKLQKEGSELRRLRLRLRQTGGQTGRCGRASFLSGLASSEDFRLALQVGSGDDSQLVLWCSVG